MPKKTIKPVTKKVTKKPVSKLEYELCIKVNGETFKTKAKSFKDALDNFIDSPVLPVAQKTIAVVEYSKGKNTANEIWNIPRGRRLFKMLSLRGSIVQVLAEKFENNIK